MVNQKSRWKTTLVIVGMLAPALIVALGIVIYPIINTVIKSFQDEATGAFTLANYTYLFTNKLSRAHIWYTIWVTFLTMILAIVISYLLALYLRFSESKAAKVISSLYLLPRFIPVLVAVYALKMIIGDSGLINRLSLLLPEGSPLYDFKPGLLYNAKGIIIANL
ncbi:MAG: ABC transporter permease, partial [Clostridia bacterium]|nr:ABC transporter permease [Clostridia bacterium]